MNITFATLFVCDGLYSRDDFVRWHAPFSAEPVVLIIAGGWRLFDVGVPKRHGKAYQKAVSDLQHVEPRVSVFESQVRNLEASV